VVGDGCCLRVEVFPRGELWHVHMDNDHLNGYMEATEGSIEAFTVSEMSQLS